METVTVFIACVLLTGCLVPDTAAVPGIADTRPLPAWFDEAKFGVMLHWGVYSVPSYGGTGASEWFWKHWKDYHQKDLIHFMTSNYKPGFSYADFARDFTAEFYNPDKWVDIIKDSGAKYVLERCKRILSHESFISLRRSDCSFKLAYTVNHALPPCSSCLILSSKTARS